MKFSSLYEFTPEGMVAFEKAFMGFLPEEALDLSNPALVHAIPGTKEFEAKYCDTAKELASAIITALGTKKVQEMLPNRGLWAWLTFVLRDTVFPRAKSGRREFGEIHRWLPSDPDDFQKAQRHLVRMPVTLLATLGENADHLLCGKPSVHGEVREQLTGQQDMFHESFQRLARTLYYDEATKKLKKGAGSKGPGTPRRLARTRRQFDVTWDLFVVDPDWLLGMLPKEYDRFKPAAKVAGTGHVPEPQSLAASA